MLEVVILILLILTNGIFAMSEMAVVASRKARLQQLSNEGNLGATKALKLVENPNRFLSTVQIGITLVGIIAGAFGGAALTEPFSKVLAKVRFFAPYADSLSIGLIILLITYLSLVVGELVPKRIALTQPEKIASLISTPMAMLSRLTSPLVGFLSASTELILRPFNIKNRDREHVTEEEISVLIDQGTKAGVFHETEQDLIKNVFWLGDLNVKSLMLSRRSVIWLDVNASQDELSKLLKQYSFNRFVVADGSLDNVLGFVQVRRVLESYLEGNEPSLRDLLEPPLYFPESSSALVALERFRDTDIHFGLVIDEYGGVEGLITLYNLLEVLFEDSENLTQEIIQRDDGSYLLDGLMPISDFKEKFNIVTLPGESDQGFLTLGGFVVSLLKHIPKAGEVFEWDSLKFEVLDMDGNRIDKVLVSTSKTEFQDA